MQNILTALNSDDIILGEKNWATNLGGGIEVLISELSFHC